MIAISLYRNKINYIQSTRKKNNFSISAYGSLKYDNYNKIISNSIDDILNTDIIKKNEKTVCFIIDSQLCFFNEIFCEDSKGLSFHENLSGSNSLSKYMESYYYPINNRDDNYIGIHINRNIKIELINSVNKHKYSLSFMGVGIFSAEVMARTIFNAKELDNYLLIRFVTSNTIEVLFLSDGLLMVYAKYKISSSKVKSVNVIGNKNHEKNIFLYLNNMIGSGAFDSNQFDKIFVYQTTGQSPIIKKIIEKNPENITLLNLFSYNQDSAQISSNSKIFNQLTFAEHGQIFRGLNV